MWNAVQTQCVYILIYNTTELKFICLIPKFSSIKKLVDENILVMKNNTNNSQGTYAIE